MAFNVDLHTHSGASPDGALTASQYRLMLQSGRLHCIAITDHNTIAFAQQLHAELGDCIIVGEEIMTTEGEIIGLFLTELVPPGLSAAEATARIRSQDGLVYVPHPFETHRKGLSKATATAIAADVDIIEVYNGRALLQHRGVMARRWARSNGVVSAASSDSHGLHGWGRTYMSLAAMPTRDTLVGLLQQATHHTGFAGLQGMLYPRINRLKKWSAKRHV
ncbi:MAG TPA: PHP domain-containing protein [Candidatus Saccharimonadales bacterium]|nr:PHP domain-containing protein [Candidatus Saccharimonadales bacterium]